jgi:hypothetical protein
MGTYHSRTTDDAAVEDLDCVAVLDLVPPQRALLLHDVLLAAAAKLCGDADPSGPTKSFCVFLIFLDEFCVFLIRPI